MVKQPPLPSRLQPNFRTLVSYARSDKCIIICHAAIATENYGYSFYQRPMCFKSNLSSSWLKSSQSGETINSCNLQEIK